MSEPRALKEGRVTRLQAQKKNPSRVSVYVDGAFAFGIYQDVVLEHGLRKGQVLTAADQARLVEADRVLVAKAKALNYLSYRDRSEQEVRRKLQQSDFSEPVVDDVVARLRELGYLDDARYAREYARARFEAGGYGPRRVRSDLMRRGVPRHAVDQALADVFDEPDDLLQAAREQAARRWPRLAREDDPLKRRKKLSDFLLRRGFTYDTVRRVVDEVAE